MPEFRLGRHINISHGFVSAPWYAQEIGCNIFQIFLGAPTRILSKEKAKAELIKFGKELTKRNLTMVIHGSYTINLCHPKGTIKYKASLKSLVQDLDASAVIGDGCLGVIIHMGKNVAEIKQSIDDAIDNYVAGIKDALGLTDPNTRIILETGASQGTEVASDIDGMAEIYWKLDREDRKRIYFCIDTCHIWASGYDISSMAGVKKYFKEFNEKIGIKKIICVHFNDSKTGLNSHVDRHADLGYGHIKSDGLRAFAQYAKEKQIPLIMETPLDSVNKETNRDITFKEELAKVKLWLE